MAPRQHPRLHGDSCQGPGHHRQGAKSEIPAGCHRASEGRGILQKLLASQPRQPAQHRATGDVKLVAAAIGNILGGRVPALIPGNSIAGVLVITIIVNLSVLALRMIGIDPSVPEMDSFANLAYRPAPAASPRRSWRNRPPRRPGPSRAPSTFPMSRFSSDDCRRHGARRRSTAAFWRHPLNAGTRPFGTQTARSSVPDLSPWPPAPGPHLGLGKGQRFDRRARQPLVLRAAAANLGVSGDWSSYSATLTGTAALGVSTGGLTLNGTSSPPAHIRSRPRRPR